MSMEFQVSGSWSKTESWLRKMTQLDVSSLLRKYGEIGVNALSNATPVDSSLTAESWYYETSMSGGNIEIVWKNSNSNDGQNIAILIQYGHGTGTGGYVSGRDYINPAIQPIFDKIVEEVWREVKR